MRNFIIVIRPQSTPAVGRYLTLDISSNDFRELSCMRRKDYKDGRTLLEELAQDGVHTPDLVELVMGGKDDSHVIFGSVRLTDERAKHYGWIDPLEERAAQSAPTI